MPTQNIFNYKIVTNGDMSANITSDVVDLSRIDGYSVYAKWTGGSAAGTIKLEVSLDDINYVDLSGSETSVSGPGEALWEITSAFYDKVRVVFTRSSGSGTLNVQINGKGEEE